MIYVSYISCLLGLALAQGTTISYQDFESDWDNWSSDTNDNTNNGMSMGSADLPFPSGMENYIMSGCPMMDEMITSTVPSISSPSYSMDAPAATATGDDMIKVDVIPVERDGQTCPDGFEASATIDNKCQYGQYVGDVPSGPGKCCFRVAEQVFVYSTKGPNSQNSDYAFDGRWCCSSGTESTASKDSGDGKRCEYGSAIVDVHAAAAKLFKKCCWDKDNSKFIVHLLDQKRATVFPINKSFSKKVFSGQSVGVDLDHADIYGGRMVVKGKIWASGIVDWSSNESFDVAYSSDWNTARNWYPGSWTTGHVSLNLETKINPDRSLDIKVHVTGTGLILGRLEETVGPFTIGDDAIKNALAWLPLCK